ncbi:MAG TPA: aminoacyl-tRNA hydrolase [bacterium]|mgnify:CR=1 FL=1|nr:aminoacyl-tRNA hydrolase [bacterium]
MKLIVGLGNPGKKYQKSRHNVGFILLDKFAADNNLKWRKSERFDSEIIEYDDKLLVKPQTFMNNSGNAVSKLVNFYKVSPDKLIIIHDDVDLPLGGVKKQKGKNSAGHHGVEDIIEKLGTKDFWRIRVGIGKPEDKNIPVDEWVLQDFGENELDIIAKLDLLSLSVSE